MLSMHDADMETVPFGTMLCVLLGSATTASWLHPMNGAKRVNLRVTTETEAALGLQKSGIHMLF